MREQKLETLDHIEARIQEMIVAAQRVGLTDIAAILERALNEARAKKDPAKR